MPTLTCFRLRGFVAGAAVTGFDDYVDKRERAVSEFGPVTSSGFTAKLYVTQRPPRAPSWRAFLMEGFVEADIPPAGATGALLLLRLNEEPPKYFALPFGVTGRFLLREHTWERGYGLKTALNLIFPSGQQGAGANRLLSVDAQRHGAETMRSRRQASRQTEFETFDVDRFRDVLSAAVGRPTSVERWGTRVTGGDSINVAVDIPFRGLGVLCRDLEKAHGRKDYRERFAWLDNIVPVVEPDEEARLLLAVVDAMKSGQTGELHLGPPQIVDWEAVTAFRLPGEKHPSRHPDLRLDDLLRQLRNRKTLPTLDPGALRTLRIRAVGADGESIHEWSLLQCMNGEIEVGETKYVLDAGAFYHVDTDYLAGLQGWLDGIPMSKTTLPNLDAAMTEREYNEGARDALAGGVLLLDRQNVKTEVRTTPVEICDLLSSERELIHIKRHFGSADLSHLFSQGYVSADLLQNNVAFREATQAKIRQVADEAGVPPGEFDFFGSDRIATDSFTVVYGIVSAWKGRTLSEALPFFSKINLRRTAEELINRGYRVAYARVDTEDAPELGAGNHN